MVQYGRLIFSHETPPQQQGCTNGVFPLFFSHVHTSRFGYITVLEMESVFPNEVHLMLPTSNPNPNILLLIYLLTVCLFSAGIRSEHLIR